MQEHAKIVSAGPSTATAKKQVGSGKTERACEHIKPISRTDATGGQPRRRPVLDADEDTRRRLLAGTRSADGRRRSPIIDADAPNSFSTPGRVVELPVAHIPTPRRWQGRVVNQAEIDAFNERYAGCLIKPVYGQE